MVFVGISPMTAGVVLFVSFLMVLGGRTKRRLELKSSTCLVCHREKKHCTCRWL